ncbi:Ankyrin repeat-containing protein [Fodinibius salinus]|uniref:Ankyrin repeat-containing protein n=1 Tax=Fodinibius salinus TaxID=860790 RepID=A0A5D3YJY9_9BACT|nr:ankyrin repeat domain-containing protein [Fodinibius salinus]TYP93760.1 Ankyrin repeat-containing protein [Fodinibius salinus]
MKTLKGLLLVFSISILAVTAPKANSDIPKIADNIFTAIRTIDYTSINILLAEDMDIDTVDHNGNTPLMVAAGIGNPRILKIILSHNPNINKQNKNGMTALMIAAKSGQFYIVRKLIERGGDDSIQDSDGNTALTLASKFAHNQIVHYLMTTKRSNTRTYTK